MVAALLAPQAAYSALYPVLIESVYYNPRTAILCSTPSLILLRVTAIFMHVRAGMRGGDAILKGIDS